MIIIKFKDGSDWFDSNWVFRQLAKDTLEWFPGDAALKMALDKAQAFGGLYLDSMEDSTADAILKPLGKVAKATIDRKILSLENAFSEDNEGRQRYVKSITGLFLMIKDRTSIE